MGLLRSRRLWAAFLAVSGSVLGQQTTGLTPRSKPEDYAVRASGGETTYAGTLLTPDQVKHIFASDISKKYLVFEVACYPQAGAIDMHPDSFVVEAGDGKDVVRPADPMTVAARMQQKKSNPTLPGTGDSQVTTEANIGYESGTDPYTGRRVHGTYESVGVGVGHGPDARSSTIPPDWPQDMEALQRQLEDRAFPSGRFSHPVAGYLYYPKALLKKPGKNGYRLEYDGDPGEGAVLMFPPKGH